MNSQIVKITNFSYTDEFSNSFDYNKINKYFN